MKEHIEDGSYHIGHTAMPKSKGGLIAILLIVIIFLGGIISVLGMLNISLFRQLLQKNKNEQAVAVAVRDDSDANSVLDVTYGENETIILSATPQSVDHYPQAGGMSLQDIYATTVKSLVTVESGSINGTGIVITEDGYVLTNNYLLDDTGKINIRLASGEKLAATVVGRDHFSDLAVLRVEASGLTPASFGNSNSLRVGDVVVAIGSSHGTGVMADGIVSAINADISVGGDSITLIQTSAALDYEHEGGLLINCYGQIVGINTKCASNVMTTTGTESVSFSLDSVTVKSIADQLIHQGFVEGRIHLGIHGQAIDEFYQQYYNVPQGIFITSIEENSELYNRGVRKGDILINLADTPIFNFDTLNSLLQSIEQGQEVIAVVYRDGTQYQFSITIGEANDSHTEDAD